MVMQCGECGRVAGAGHRVDCTYRGVRPVRIVRDDLAVALEAVACLERELASALASEGRRPGDGSDQATLFDVAEPNLFDVEGM